MEDKLKEQEIEGNGREAQSPMTNLELKASQNNADQRSAKTSVKDPQENKSPEVVKESIKELIIVEEEKEQSVKPPA